MYTIKRLITLTVSAILASIVILPHVAKGSSVSYTYTNQQIEENLSKKSTFTKGSYLTHSENTYSDSISSNIIYSDSIANADTLIFSDTTVVIPESFEQNIDDLLHNWQLNFKSSSADCEHSSNIEFHDSIYSKRLYDLPTIMELSYNPIVKKHIELYTQKRRNLVGYMLTLGEYYFPIFEEVLDSHNLPLELKYIPVIESALNPKAVSKAGATGLWQFMLRTGKIYDLEVNSLIDERRDPYKATVAAARYMKSLYEIYGDWNLVIAAYNCGPGNVNKAIKRSKGKRDFWEIYNYLPRETRGYIPSFIAATYVMNFHDKHNICAIESKAIEPVDTVHVHEPLHFAQISNTLNIPIDDIRRLNPQYKRDIVPGNFKRYELILPTRNVYDFVENKDSIVSHQFAKYFPHRKSALPESFDDSVYFGDKGVYYKVKKGDTLGHISRKFKVPVATLKKWNNMNSTKLSIGKRLIVGKKS